ncbi:MAG: M20 family metallopeptidase [Promethearchaeota archaeon]|jgi:succinyl-diaminopimelate desuccinylase
MTLANLLKKELKEILIHLVRLPSENPPGGTKDIVRYLMLEVFREEEGFRNEVVIHKKNGLDLHNFITRIGTGKNKIIISGHLDVVPAGDQSKWIYPPFSATIINGRLYGRGSADMKGGLTSIIGVMKTLKENKEFLRESELIFVGTADEESGMSGSFTLTTNGIMENAKLLIIAEPTNLKIGIAEKGAIWVSLKIYGKAAHGSTPEEGANAIEGGLMLIPKLQNCLDSKKNPILGTSTLNIGKFQGGTKINVVPDYAEMELDYRVIPEQSPEALINKLKAIKLDPFQLEFDLKNNLPALQTNSNHSFIKNLRSIENAELTGLSYATDAAKFISPDNPIPFVIYGPGNPSEAHKINESIPIHQIFKATEILSGALVKTYTND